MLKRLHLRNFTVFANAEFAFQKGLNVLVGTNGTGKTHIVPYYPEELIQRGKKKSQLDVEVNLVDSIIESEVDFIRRSVREPMVKWNNLTKTSDEFLDSVFIPAKEVLTLGWLPALYGRFDIPFDETYPDLLRLLSGP
nr:hypothetical protein [Tanacetum cinerariifolium]